MPPRRRNETDETGATTPSAVVEPQRYSDGNEGWSAGNVAPDTKWVTINDDGTEGDVADKQPERGFVLVAKGDTVTPDVARRIEQR